MLHTNHTMPAAGLQSAATPHWHNRQRNLSCKGRLRTVSTVPGSSQQVASTTIGMSSMSPASPAYPAVVHLMLHTADDADHYYKACTGHCCRTAACSSHPGPAGTGTGDRIDRTPARLTAALYPHYSCLDHACLSPPNACHPAEQAAYLKGMGISCCTAASASES